MEKPITEKQVDKMAERVYDLAGSGVKDLVEVVKKPWRLIWVNFLVSLARGIGFSLGVSFVGAALIAITFSILSNMVDLPLVGKFAAKFLTTVQDQMKHLSKSPK